MGYQLTRLPKWCVNLWRIFWFWVLVYCARWFYHFTRFTQHDSRPDSFSLSEVYKDVKVELRLSRMNELPNKSRRSTIRCGSVIFGFLVKKQTFLFRVFNSTPDKNSKVLRNERERKKVSIQLQRVLKSRAPVVSLLWVVMCAWRHNTFICDWVNYSPKKERNFMIALIRLCGRRAQWRKITFRFTNISR